MKNIFLFTLLLVVLKSNSLSAQTCNCEQDFNWMIKTFSENDAGYNFIKEKKGKDALDVHTAQIREKVKGVNSADKCQLILYEWLKFFRGGHIGIIVNTNADTNSTGLHEEKPGAIREKYKNEERVSVSYKKYTEQYAQTKKHHLLEGVWSNGQYTVTVFPSKDTAVLVGVVLHADSVYWVPGQIKMRINKKVSPDGYTTKYAMKNHTVNSTNLTMTGNSKNIFNVMDNSWYRIFPANAYSIEDSMCMAMQTPYPLIKKLSKNTLYLRIPSFNHTQKPFIDSVLKANDVALRSIPNLIIDIRNGTGGSDFAYGGIMPYLYTNPIRNVGARPYATELNAKAYEGYAKLYADTAGKNEQLRTAASMRKNAGKFIGSDTIEVYIDTMKEVLLFPKYVAIVCNHNNGSTDEQFLIDARQSKKVKIFGAPTGGMLDFSNLNSTNSPDGIFQLYYTTTKSCRVPAYCIDDIGVQPDIYLDESLPEYKWISYIQSYLEY